MPYGGTVVRQDGKPTGMFRESAMDLVATEAFAEFDDASVKAGTAYLAALWARRGYTALVDLMGATGLRLMRPHVFRELEQEGKLPLRVFYCYTVLELADLEEAATYLGQDTDRVRFLGEALRRRGLRRRAGLDLLAAPVPGWFARGAADHHRRRPRARAEREPDRRPGRAARPEHALPHAGGPRDQGRARRARPRSRRDREAHGHPHPHPPRLPDRRAHRSPPRRERPCRRPARGRDDPAGLLERGGRHRPVLRRPGPRLPAEEARRQRRLGGDQHGLRRLAG